jgi:hypothetical protein
VQFFKLALTSLVILRCLFDIEIKSFFAQTGFGWKITQATILGPLLFLLAFCNFTYLKVSYYNASESNNLNEQNMSTLDIYQAMAFIIL